MFWFLPQSHYSVYFSVHFLSQRMSLNFWNMLESTPARINLIESSHIWTRIIFIISNSKLGIWLCSNPIIDLNSQSNLYDVLTLDHTRIFPTNIQTTHSEHILHLVPPGYDPFTQVLRNFLFLCIRCWQETIVMTTHAQNFEFLICQSHNLLPTSLPQKRRFKIL